MFKFLRKYSVWILGFGGTLLLIAFLAPNVIQQLAQQAGYASSVQATVGDDESVSFDDWQQNLRESQIIDRLDIPIQGIGTLESPSHWFLLSREADLAGLTPSISVVGIDEITLFNFAATTGTRPQLVLETLAHLQGIQRLVQLYQTAGKFSDRRLLRAADDLLSSVAVETVVIPSTPEDNISFSDESLQAQLEAWADTPTGEGDHGFGYKVPDRFKVEWLRISADSIKNAAMLSKDFSSRAQRKFWRRNENDPRFPSVDSSTTIPEVVVDAYLETLTDKTRVEISRSASEELRNPRRGIDEVDGILVLPDDWNSKQVSFEQLASSLQEEFEISLPSYGAVATWTETGDASNTPDIGSLFAVNLGDFPVDFQTLVASASEFGGDGVYRIQEGVASQLLETPDGDLFVFRMTDTDPTRAPHSLEEVREAVMFDLGRIARWEMIQAEADSIEQLARDNGLLAASIKYNTSVNRPQPVSMVETGVPTLFDPATRRPLMTQSILQRLSVGLQISDMVSKIPSLEKSDVSVIQTIIDNAADLPLNTPIGSLPVEDRIFIVPSHKNMALVLVRVTGTSPASSELAADFTGSNSAILQTLVSFDELGGLEEVASAFSYEALAKRHNFERGRQVAEEDIDTAAN